MKKLIITLALTSVSLTSFAQTPEVVTKACGEIEKSAQVVLLKLTTGDKSIDELREQVRMLPANKQNWSNRIVETTYHHMLTFQGTQSESVAVHAEQTRKACIRNFCSMQQSLCFRMYD